MFCFKIYNLLSNLIIITIIIITIIIIIYTIDFIKYCTITIKIYC